MLSSNNNALCNSSKLFTTSNPGDMGPLDILLNVTNFSDLDGIVSIYM